MTLMFNKFRASTAIAAAVLYNLLMIALLLAGLVLAVAVSISQKDDGVRIYALAGAVLVVLAAAVLLFPGALMIRSAGAAVGLVGSAIYIDSRFIEVSKSNERLRFEIERLEIRSTRVGLEFRDKAMNGSPLLVIPWQFLTRLAYAELKRAVKVTQS